MSGEVLVLAANLHGGGGVAVATSVIHEMTQLRHDAARVTVLASTEIDRNLRELQSPLESLADYHTVDTYGVGALRARLPVDPNDFPAVLTVFGPVYLLQDGNPSVVGFAQPWIAYPKNEVYARMNFRTRAILRTKYRMVAAAFARADCLVVEQQHVRRALLSRPLFRSKRIEIVPNVVDSLHFDAGRWAAPVEIGPRRADLRLGLVSRNYPHKNLGVVPQVLKLLWSRYRISAEFWVTFSPAEYARTSPEFRESVSTVGSLSLNQTPAFYRQLDGVLFPSLLECFSATPIEALAARVPLFASDRDFVRETVGEHADYFDPLEPADIARVIAEHYLRPSVEREASLEAGFQYVAGSRYTSRDRALELLRIADEEAARASRRRAHSHAP